MHFLGLEGSFPRLSFCVGSSDKNGSLWTDASGPGDGSHNEGIGSIAGDLLKKSGLCFSDIDFLVVGSGPGSFTGLRIAFSFMKGLAAALDIPLIRAETFRACAEEFAAAGHPLLVIADAGRGEVFNAGFDIAHGVPVGRWDPRISSASGAIQDARSLGDFIAISADGVRIEGVEELREPLYPARGLVLQALELVKETSDIKGFAGQRRQDLWSVGPTYLRAVNAKKISERLAAKAG